ncbi:MAG: hypothetical protein CM15mP125_1000 [Gammaproteobacteria bacterium]|nr:MAG: hypothetical protein CM15mP125_1000 [Gammaproteobacteria bacterium]
MSFIVYLGKLGVIHPQNTFVNSDFLFVKIINPLSYSVKRASPPKGPIE